MTENLPPKQKQRRRGQYWNHNLEKSAEKREQRSRDQAKISKAAKQALVERAKNLKFAQFDDDIIKEATGLEENEIEKVVDNVNNIVKLHSIKSIYECSLDILATSLKTLAHDVVISGTKLEVRDIERVMNIVSQLDKIKRLDECLPTENLAVTAITIEQARTILAEDPYCNPPAQIEGDDVFSATASAKSIDNTQ